MKLTTVSTQGAQGDVLVTRIGSVPDGVQPTPRRDDEPIVVAHSETGHHHTIDAADVIQYQPENPLVCYLRVDRDYADIVHHRSFDTHGTLRLPRGIYEIRRDREWNPWTKSDRRAQD